LWSKWLQMSDTGFKPFVPAARTDYPTRLIMNKRITVRVAAGTIAAALLGMAALAAPAQAKDSAWGGTVAPKDTAQSFRIIGAPSHGGADYVRIIG
jgi:hypothetical protein